MGWINMTKYLELNAKVTVKSDGKMGEQKPKNEGDKPDAKKG